MINLSLMNIGGGGWLLLLDVVGGLEYCRWCVALNLRWWVALNLRWWVALNIGGGGWP